MSFVNDELTRKVRGHFKLDLHSRISDAAVKAFDHEDNPLRLNYFAFALRELGRVWLDQLAPKERIRECEWFEQDTDVREKDGVTRRQRVQYAVQGELHDDFVSEQLRIDVQSTVKEYLDLINKLSRYVHNIEESFDPPTETAELQAIRALEVFDELAELIQERHDSLLSSAGDAAKIALIRRLFSEVNDELDRLSTHSSIEDVQLESLVILSLDPERILYQGSGSIEVRLQYGSDSDVAKDDGLVMHDDYPWECSFEAATSDPLWISIVPGSLKIDTDSFYDEGEVATAP